VEGECPVVVLVVVVVALLQGQLVGVVADGHQAWAQAAVQAGGQQGHVGVG